MKKAKRIFALIGAVLLIGMYLCTLLFALIDHPLADTLFKASLACTVIFPVLIYGYLLVYRITRGNSDSDEMHSDN